MFVVVLVISMLLTIGVFAARSATLSTSASGYERQMTQTHYTSEYALLFAVAKLSTGVGESILNQARTAPLQTCEAQSQLTQRSCYKFSYQELQAVFTPLGQKTFESHSLGSPDIEAEFLVELTDVNGPAAAVAGFGLNAGNQAPKFYNVTAKAIGQVRTKNTGGNKLDSTASGTASIESSRAHLRVGPFN